MSLSRLDTETIVRAFEVMGAYLRDRNLIGEIAVYGGTAILLQFPWRTATDDVDAVFSRGDAEASMKDAAAYAATPLRLPDDWLNNAVSGLLLSRNRTTSSCCRVTIRRETVRD